MNESFKTDELKKARLAAFHLLKIRGRSEKELRGRLKQKKFSSAIIETTIDHLKKTRFIDDRQFARSWIQSRLTKPFGLRRISLELIQKGIDKELLREELAFAKEGFSEDAALKELIQKCRVKYKDVESAKRRQRIFGYLARRGFSIEAIESALQKS